MKTIGYIVAIILLTGLAYYFLSSIGGAANGREGEYLYKAKCQDCHGEDGLGFKDLYPPLAGSDYLQAIDDETLICMIRNGLKGEIIVNGKTYNQPMAPILRLTPADIANLVNYVREKWGKENPNWVPSNVQKVLDVCAE